MSLEYRITIPTVGVAASVALLLFSGCGEPMFENAGSQRSLMEDREACTVELEQSPAALAYRQNPSAHPDYVSQVFEEMNRCIERKGWKQVRSQQEQEQVRGTVISELAQTGQPAPRSDPKAAEALMNNAGYRATRKTSSMVVSPMKAFASPS